jgi:hypothetical protein
MWIILLKVLLLMNALGWTWWNVNAFIVDVYFNNEEAFSGFLILPLLSWGLFYGINLLII